MRARGKKSAAALAVVQPGSITAITRPIAPDGLTNAQATEWRNIINRMPADWFPSETHALLVQYCRHVVSAACVAEMIENLFASDDPELEAYNKLLIMQEREGRALSSLATRMRITQQTTFDKSKKKRTPIKLPHES